MLKPVLFQAEDDVCRMMNQVKELFFPGRNIACFRVRNQDVDVCRRQVPERAHDPLQALQAFPRFYLFVVIGVQQPENNHERAGSAAEKTGKLYRDGGLHLKCRKRSRQVRPLQNRLRRKREECGDPGKSVAVKFHRPVHDGERALHGAADQKAHRVHKRMAVEQVKSRRPALHVAECGIESREKLRFDRM